MASSCPCSCTAMMRGAHASSGDWAKQSILSSVRNSHCCACPVPPAKRASQCPQKALYTSWLYCHACHYDMSIILNTGADIPLYAMRSNRDACHGQ